MPIQKVLNGASVPVKIWTPEVEEQAQQQLLNIAALPFVHKHVACMPDVHAGYGATIGSVVPTTGAIIPSAVGVDIGCGMMAYQTTLRAKDLPDNLRKIRDAIEAAVPCGRTDNGGKNDRGGWGDNVPKDVLTWWRENGVHAQLDHVLDRHPDLMKGNVNTFNHLGTLGTGNHFIELCLDERDQVWVMLHSGSRGVGNRIGSYFIELAKKDMERYFIQLPDKDLSYLPEGTQYFDDYVDAVHWAQEYARANREFMMQAIMDAMIKSLGRTFGVTDMAVNCHHNYVAKENHYGKNVWVTRKGAVRAREGDLGIIPGSMGARSYIVRGLGNEESFHSCSHGAGRTMSRTRARALFTADDLAAQTHGIECRKDDGVIDEIPSAYKNIDEVMENQNDLVEVLYTLRQIVNVKG